tara:strand:+ start:132 stop:527 length:396 start_codon:yes stop_codon:yes gene_type:complete
MTSNFLEIKPKNIYKPFGNYSHAIVNKNSGLLTVSGQLGIDRNGNIPKLFSEQAELCFSNIKSILEEANYNLSDIMKVTSFVTHRKYFKEYMRVRDKFFYELKVKPTSTLLIVSGFTKASFFIEIEVIAQK